MHGCAASSPAARIASAVAGACSALVSMSSEPPGTSQPTRAGDHAALHVEAVGAAIERDQGLVLARFRRHVRDLGGRYIRGVGDEHVDAAAQAGGKRVVQIALEDAVAARRLRRATATSAGSTSAA